MIRWFQRMALTAAVGVFAGGAALADQPMPAAPVGAAPVPAPTFVQAPGAPTYVQGGCGSCGTVASDCCDSGRYGRIGKHHGKRGGLLIGEGCANTVGCGSCATYKTFVFGSCNQFFSPGNDCGHFGHGLLGGGLFRGRDVCATPPLGTGIIPPGPWC